MQMNTHVDKEPQNKGQSAANPISQAAKKPTSQFMDNRPEARANRALQEMASDSVQAKHATQLQAMANQSVHQQQPENINAGQGVIQNAIDVTAAGAGTKEVSIKAKGDAIDFRNGNSAGNRGWNNVISYYGRAYIDRSYYKRARDGSKKWYIDHEVVRDGPYDNDYRAAEAGHVLAKQNGGYGSDSDNVFAQDGGVNNGPWKTNFENPMRRILDNCYDDDKVDFRVGLYGDKKITKGDLKKAGKNLKASHQDIFDTTDESDSGSGSD
jgi:hypothetical protein